MKFLIFALFVVPTVYSLSVIPGEALQKAGVYDQNGVEKITSVTIDVKKANELNRFTQHRNIAEDFLSSSTDVDGNGKPDNQQVEYVQPIIGPAASWSPYNAGKPLIPNEAFNRVWDHKKGVVESIKIDVEKIRQGLKPHFPLPGSFPLIVDDGKDGVVVERNNRKKRQAIPYYELPLKVEHPNFAEDYVRKSTDLNRDGQPDVTQYPYVPPTYGFIPYPFGAGLRYWY